MISRDSKRRLPPYVHVSGKSYWHREFLGRKDGRIQWGSRVRLCPSDAPVSAVWSAYENLEAAEKRTLTWLLNTYFSSRAFSELKPKTQVDYRQFAKSLCGVVLKDGSRFGSTHISTINQRVIQLYLDNYPARVAANRHIALVKLAWNHTQCRFDGLNPNPTIGVRLNREVPRTRYISNDELDHALSLAPPWLNASMQIAYHCRARRSEVHALLRSSVDGAGVMLRRGKGSRDEITLFTPRLRLVVDEAMSLEGSSEHLIRTKRGGIGNAQFKSAWSRLMAKVECEKFTYHDLKAKGLSDMLNPTAGHKSAKMLDVYLRKPMKVMPEYDSVTNSVTKK